MSSECDDLRNQLNSIEQDKESFETQHKDLIDKLNLKDVNINLFDLISYKNLRFKFFYLRMKINY